MRWNLLLPRATGDVAADAQASLFFETGWGILADTAFLRVDSWRGAARIQIVETGLPDRSESLPSLDAAPAFYLIGRPPRVEVGDRDGFIRYIADDPDEVLKRISPLQHAAALTYLRAVIGPDNLRELPRLTVVWLPVSRARGALGGAAGENAMLVNYFGERESPTPEEALMPFAILLHEQFHQLVAAELPLWAAESLAQYYALKAATRTAGDGAAVAALWSKLVNGPPATGSLLAIQRQVLERGDTSNYDRFYTDGPRFWLALDRAIQDASEGTQTLDALLPLLLKSGFDAEGSLSPSVRSALGRLPPGQLDRLIDRFVNRLQPAP